MRFLDPPLNLVKVVYAAIDMSIIQEFEPHMHLCVKELIMQKLYTRLAISFY